MISIHSKQDQIIKKEFLNRIKSILSLINHATLQTIKSNPFLYKLLYCIGYLQLIYFSINPKIPQMYTISVVVYLRTLCRYFQFEGNLMNISSSLYIFFMLGMLLIQLIIIGLTLLLVVKSYNRIKLSISEGIFETINTIVSYLVILYQ